MNKRLAYLFICLAAVFFSSVACTDYGDPQQLDNLRERGKLLGADAEALAALIMAVQQKDELESFGPIEEEGTSVGYKAVFKNAGDVVVYNRKSNIQVGQEEGKYYWMADGTWLVEGNGNKVEITQKTPIPQFSVIDGVLKVSVDGGKSFKPLGDVDKYLITSIEEDDKQVVLTLSGGAVVTLQKYQAFNLTLNGDDTVIGAGESIIVAYKIEGAENATVQVLCGTGWHAVVTAATPTTGTIEITAPTPIIQDKLIASATDDNGRMVEVEMRLVIDESTTPEPPEMLVSEEELFFSASESSQTLVVTSNVPYAYNSSEEWVKITGEIQEEETLFYVNVDANDSFEERVATISFHSEQAGLQKSVAVSQAGRQFVIPSAATGYQFFKSNGNYNYRYGPGIICHEDGSIDVWTAKEGSKYLNYSDYLYQETGTRSQVPAEGKVIAQYFNTQHRFMRVLVALYGTGQSTDKINLRLYQWAGSYEATLATSPIGTYEISAALPSTGNRYSIYKPDKSWIPAGEYMWTATDATEGVGVFKYPGAGTISVTDSRSYVDGVLAEDYNFQGKLRGSTNNNSNFVDRFAYWHSSDGGVTWSEERDVMFPTEGSEDHYSVCDPGAAYFGGWYYIAYTSAPSQYNGKYNHCYVARSHTPVGPWYKWNGSGWGGDPAKIISFTGTTSQWGAGEPCIVVKDDIIYFYYTWTESDDAEHNPTTRLATAPVSENWPANLTVYGKVIDKSQFQNADHSDIKYVEDYKLFYAFHTYNRYRSGSRIAVWTSTDGKNFTYRGDITGNLVPYAGNLGVSGDGMGHIRITEPQILGYSYGGNASGNWSTWFNPILFN